MPTTTLVTTFDTWLPHQESNASDDLVRLWLSSTSDANPPSSAFLNSSSHQVHVLHHLPVDTKAAYAKILQAIEQYRPSYVIACGMAESRKRLSLEARATQPIETQAIETQDLAPQNSQLRIQDQTVYWTPISLTGLCSLRKSLKRTGISYDAGKFVCNETYYRLLKHHSEDSTFPPALFLHVPLLTPKNRADLLHDFQRILEFFAAL